MGCRRFFAFVGVAAFNLALVAMTAPVWLVVRVCFCAVACCCCCRKERAREAVSRFTKRSVLLAWRAALVLSCCWIRIRTRGLRTMRRGLSSASGRPRVVIINHASQFDAILSLSLMPLGAVAQVKTLASEHVFRMPVVGFLMKAMRQLRVPFKTQSSDDFTVDKGEMSKVQQELEDWVRAGNIALWFPEGRLNRSDVTVLEQFRAGGMQLPVHVDCEIWCMVCLGNAACWPLKAALGGRPCRIDVRCFQLCKSSHQLLQESTGCPLESLDDRAKSISLANTAKDSMQAQLDEIIAEGWASISPSQKESPNSRKVVPSPEKKESTVPDERRQEHDAP